MKICVPIKARNMAVLALNLKSAEEKVDMTEIWLDQISDLNLENIFKIRTKPMIGVVKSPKEFGLFIDSNEKRNIILKKFIELGGEYIDCRNNLKDFKNFYFFQNLKKDFEFKIIGSFHDFEKTPNFKILNKIIVQLNLLNVDIIKIATKVNCENDLKILGKSVEKILSLNKMSIVLGMGNLGKNTRLGKGIFSKNYLTFVALSEEGKTAEGQITVDEILDFKL
jgi:3-dehydroquinate dehydratase-1